jgi:hypothetical protein
VVGFIQGCLLRGRGMKAEGMKAEGVKGEAEEIVRLGVKQETRNSTFSSLTSECQRQHREQGDTDVDLYRDDAA